MCFCVKESYFVQELMKMFYAVFQDFPEDKVPENIKEFFNAQTELFYTLLSTNRLKLKNFTDKEHLEGIVEFLTITGYNEIISEKFVEDFANAVLPGVLELVKILPEKPDVSLEKFFLVPDMFQMMIHFPTDFIEDHLSRIEQLSESMSMKHFGYVRRPKTD